METYSLSPNLVNIRGKIALKEFRSATHLLFAPGEERVFGAVSSTKITIRAQDCWSLSLFLFDPLYQAFSFFNTSCNGRRSDRNGRQAPGGGLNPGGFLGHARSGAFGAVRRAQI